MGCTPKDYTHFAFPSSEAVGSSIPWRLDGRMLEATLQDPKPVYCSVNRYIYIYIYIYISLSLSPSLSLSLLLFLLLLSLSLSLYITATITNTIILLQLHYQGGCLFFSFVKLVLKHLESHLSRGRTRNVKLIFVAWPECRISYGPHHYPKP